MRKTLCLLLSGLLTMMQLTLSVASAQSLPDAEPPVIELERILTGEAGTAQVFTAQVVDDRELVDVVLYHRRAGRQPFTGSPMQALGDTAFFSATIVTEPDDARAIEYYVQARDGGGNRTVDGYAFDPHSRTLSVVPNVMAKVPSAPVSPNSSEAADTPSFTVGGVPWWQIALGAVAVGALAAAAGGSSGGSSDQDDGTVPLTINLTEPR